MLDAARELAVTHEQGRTPIYIVRGVNWEPFGWVYKRSSDPLIKSLVELTALCKVLINGKTPKKLKGSNHQLTTRQREDNSNIAVRSY